MSSLTDFVGGGIKSIQRGTISIGSLASSATATITAVNTSKTMLNFLGCYTSTSSDSIYLPLLTLTNSTTVTASKGATGVSATVSYEVIEFY